MGGGLRYFAGAAAFGFAAVWIMASLAGALVCLLSALVAYGAVVVGERTRARRARPADRADATPTLLAPPNPSPEVEDLPRWAEVLNSDLGHVYDPSATMSPLAHEAEYGWPVIDDPVVASGLLD